MLRASGGWSRTWRSTRKKGVEGAPPPIVRAWSCQLAPGRVRMANLEQIACARSPDLSRRPRAQRVREPARESSPDRGEARIARALGIGLGQVPAADRKSTRLNSSHLGISYAGFCLK